MHLRFIRVLGKTSAAEKELRRHVFTKFCRFGRPDRAVIHRCEGAKMLTAVRPMELDRRFPGFLKLGVSVR